MKKMIVSTFLATSLVCSGAALAITKKSNLTTDWYANPGASFEIPIEFKQPENGYSATIMLKSAYLCNFVDPSECPKPSHVMVLFNGKPVFHGEDVVGDSTIIFNIKENGVLTIKNLDTEGGPAYGYITLNL